MKLLQTSPLTVTPSGQGKSVIVSRGCLLITVTVSGEICIAMAVIIDHTQPLNYLDIT